MQRDDDGETAETTEWERSLEYWRTMSAQEFGPVEIEEVETCVCSISSTMKDWREAVRGDAAAAIRLVLPQKPPERITLKVDLAMTVLLCRALDNAAAALVLSHKLRSMPLDRSLRNRLVTSWRLRFLRIRFATGTPTARRA
ncbi:hypothetical protein IQ16_00726 [Bradyrhizobium huanghuaihaiense]|uniref:Uncharacterized protein n=2 Tax=Bradyrhizobium huanghuaihaiense TaxID=990078 RepID=A0A562S5E2_9BRAD|nr:hypothetical protein IQ16_00726 [Bradyrhizobium huanghuaihaiense]